MTNRKYNCRLSRLVRPALLLLLAVLALAQTPTVVTLTFEGLKDSEPVNFYYDGG
jgi:hypothetical protein